jgi:hypothetical protein
MIGVVWEQIDPHPLTQNPENEISRGSSFMELFF